MMMLLTDKVKFMKKYITSKNTVILIFILYFLLGLFIYKGYGVSWDEHTERASSIVNYFHVMDKLISTQSNEDVRKLVENIPKLEESGNRYYGVALQCITVFYEHLKGFESFRTGILRDVYLMRHLFTFMNFWVGGIFFYLILRRRFGETWISVLGTLFYILYPRFFGESYYNIKDILFFSWCVIASYFILRWLEDEKKDAFLIPAALTIAVATNTRILGISILLLAGGFTFLYGVQHKEVLAYQMRRFSLLCVLTFAFYVIVTPFTWVNPIKNTIDIFFHFLRFPVWNFTHFYLGDMITRDVPWHYIPVWMSVTIPILYIGLFFIGMGAVAISLAKTAKKRVKVPHLYDLFFAAMFVLTLFGFILLSIDMYEGWRHAYVIFFPFLYIAVYGLERSYLFMQKKKGWYRIGFACIVTASFLHSSIWMIVNHPYQYVYFNVIGKRFAEKNFTLDYWSVSAYDMVQYAIAHSDKPVTSIYFMPFIENIMTLDDKDRVLLAEKETADYYIQCSRVSYTEREYGPGEDFVEIASITVDGMKIARLFKRVVP